MAAGKWISDLSADTPVQDAARHALTVRLDVVRQYLPLALHQAGEDPEYVHQLRVGTRRAGAALEIFRACLPEKSHRKARKYLKRLRRAAWAARDWDVFALFLAEWKPPHPAKSRPGLDYLHGYCAGQRRAAQRFLEEAAQDYPFDLDKLLAETVAAVHRPEGDDAPETLVELARPRLRQLLGELNQAASGNLKDYDHLHQVRIVGKRLRYALEVFADCFGPALRDPVYPAVEQMQEILGSANDSHVAAARLTGLRDALAHSRARDAKRYRPGLDALIDYHQEQLPRERRRFLDWWDAWHRDGTEAALTALLTPPCD